MSADELRIGLVGAGRLAELGYLPAFAELAGARLVAVADRDPIRRERLAARAARAGIAVTTCVDAASMLEHVAPDAVVLATPVAAHVADAELAAGAGVAVLVEKPPAPDAASTAALGALGPSVWVGFNRRYDPGARRVRAAASGATDLVVHAEIRYRRGGWAAHTARDDALLDLGPHLVDWVRWVSGREVREVRAARTTSEHAVAELVLERGRATIRAATDAPHHERLELRDATGRTRALHRAGGLAAAVRGRLAPGPHPLVATLAAELADFVIAARGGPSGQLGSVADGVAVMAVLDAARASARDDGRPASVTARELRRPEGTASSGSRSPAAPTPED